MCQVGTGCPVLSYSDMLLPSEHVPEFPLWAVLGGPLATCTGVACEQNPLCAGGLVGAKWTLSW